MRHWKVLAIMVAVLVSCYGLAVANYPTLLFSATVVPPPPSATISALTLNGNTTASFQAPTSTLTSISSVNPTCSNGTCAGVAVSLSTTQGGCTATTGANNGSFFETSPDTSIITGGQTGSLLSGDGTWTFGNPHPGTTDYYILLNGSQQAAWAVTLQMTNGTIYQKNAAGQWYYYRGNWVSTTAPTQATPATPQSLIVNAGVTAGTYKVCNIASGGAYSNSPFGASYTVTGTGGGVTGCVSGSICPSGRTYTIVFDEEMSKGSLSSLFNPISRQPGSDGGGCNCWSDGVNGFSFPGDGTLTMNGWAAENVSGNSSHWHGGITISSAHRYATPGFYEIKSSIGSDWNGMFTLGNYVCPAQVPNEMDFVENPVAHGFIAAYNHPEGGCGGGGTTIANMGTDLSGVHLYGFDMSPTRGLTVYVDGVSKGNLPVGQFAGLCPSIDGCPNGTANIWIQAGGPGGDSIPMKIYWIRYYTETPQ